MAGLLERGESRPAWCRTAWSDQGQLLAAHVFDSWSPVGVPGDVPAFVHLLGHTDRTAAVALLVHDLAAFAARSVQAQVTVDADASPSVRAQRLAQRQILTAAGFHLEVERVRLAWPERTPVPRPDHTLTFRPAASVAPATLERIFREVGDGSVDHGMRTERAELGRAREAAERLSRASHRDSPEGWFVVGVDATGAAVGYVQSAVVNGDRAILAEIGVVRSHRGHRHVDRLLAHGTAVVLDAGMPTLVADTDRQNSAMRAAFARIGYVEFATRSDFRWRAG